ncbi:DUF2291 family protein [Paratractidigestivibacter sp.]|uniref:DUF2291 family protein n=1 Tax=Paratractidigestivibacter sp. TaxID=2847316 RepID=UPI002ABE88C4|nr:DUF2291 family protein [Paratractidigestivibacter sp.]
MVKSNKLARTVAAGSLAAILGVSALGMAGCVTVVKIGDEAALTGQTTFDATAYVEEKWSGVVEEISGEATDLATLLSESGGKPSSVADKYAVGSSKKCFAVKGTGTVASVEEGNNGALVVTLDDYADAQVTIQVGPIYKGSTIRDALNNVSAQDFTNQVEWGELKTALNAKVASDVVGKVDTASAAGKKVTFCGTFTGDTLTITPVQLELS